MSVDRKIAVGDLGLFSLLAVPGIGSALVEALLKLNALAGLPGDSEMSGLSPLLLSLVGFLGAGFAWARLRAPEGLLVTPAMWVKLAAGGLFVLAVSGGAAAILLVLAAVDLGAALVLWRQGRRA